MAPGRKSADVWEKFERSKKDGNCGLWAICKNCRVGMQGIPERLKKHLASCERVVPAKVAKSTTITSFVSSTKTSGKQQIDQALDDFLCNQYTTPESSIPVFASY